MPIIYFKLTAGKLPVKRHSGCPPFGALQKRDERILCQMLSDLERIFGARIHTGVTRYLIIACGPEVKCYLQFSIKTYLPIL